MRCAPLLALAIAGSAAAEPWVPLDGASLPALSGAAAAVDPASGEIFVFGGLDADWNLVATTWIRQAGTWELQAPPPDALEPRWHASMAYDARRRCVVLAGGIGHLARGLTDVWELHAGSVSWTPGAALPVDFTFAFRALHYGRYGAGSEDGRLSPLFVGYPNLVRGYDTGSFDASECGPNPNAACPVFDQLLGSKMLVGNAELRFPPFGALTGSRRNLYGPLPMELVFFADTGVAWTEDIKPSFLDGSRDFVSSFGAGARVNLFGYAVVEVDYVRPLDREGWHWQFNFTPGF